jgi:peptide/nickel transport system permease protein
MTERDDTPAAESALAATAPVAAPRIAEASNIGRPPRSQWADVWQQFKSHRGALWGAAVFA